MNDTTVIMAAITNIPKEGRIMDPQTFELIVKTLVNSGKPEEVV